MRILVLAIFAVCAPAAELHDAARACDVGRLRSLLASGAAVNEPGERGMTALHVAVDAGKPVCVRLLVEAGADRTLRDAQGRTALDAASAITTAKLRGEIRQSLFLVGAPSSVTAGSQPIQWTLEEALKRREPEVARMLLDLGVDPNRAGAAGATPLSEAALKGDLVAVRLLLQKGARVDMVSQAGTQAIHEAALGGHAAVIRELAGRGADVNARTPVEGQTPLHVAALMGRLEAVAALAELGAEVEAKDAGGRTPRQRAEAAGLAEMAAAIAELETKRRK